MHERNRNLVVRLDEREHAMVRALAEATDKPATMIVRELLRAAYLDRFGVAALPKKNGGGR